MPGNSSGRGNRGNSEQHRKAGQAGGRAQGKENNPGNFANRSHEDVVDAARKGGES